MKAETWNQVKDLLNNVLEIEPGGRSDFLAQSKVSPEIISEVESLLACENAATGLMDAPAIAFAQSFLGDDEPDNALIGQNIGVYKIVGELGYGGMGAVYLAERADGKFEQRVALKLLKRELNTSSLRQRFEQERQILASLEHPNIARLLDAGATDDGVPYFAMEYIEGLPIDVYCRHNDLTLDERLDLFREVCAAVNFAHRNLVVHRDLKPSNILVNHDRKPKLLDFGISKIISEEFGQTATVTKLGAMTPSYASPEQLQNKGTSTATDIYSLGVVLYELLSGHRPFESREHDLKEIFQAVIEADPPAPSSITGTQSGGLQFRSAVENGDSKIHTGANRSGDTRPHAVAINAQFLRGDLDNIVLKALKKEPERRYSSAENLAEDIRRHQQGLTVTARPDVFSYRAAKFIRRNRFTVGAGAMILLAVIAGVVATLWQARVARAERAKAESRFNDVRKLANSYIFDVYPEIENLEGSLKAREKILTNALAYLDSLSHEASGDLELQSELATAYEKIGDVQGALTNSSLGNIQAGLDSYTKAAKLREAVYAANPADLESKEKLAANYYTTARTLWNNSQTKEATEAFERSLTLRRELVAAQPGSVEYQDRLAVLLIDYGAIPVFNSQTDKALILFDEALIIVERLRGQEPDNPAFKKTQTRLLRIMSKAKGSTGDYDGALRGFARAIEISHELAKQFPNDFRVQRSVWLTNSMKCELYIDKEDGQEGVAACLPTIDFPKAALEKEPENGVVAYDLAISHFNTARAYRFAGDYTNTIAQAEKAILVMTALSKKTPDNMEYRRNLAVYETERARAQIKLGRYDEAQAIAQKVIEMMIPIAEADKETTTYQYDLAIAYRLSAEAFAHRNNKPKAVENIKKALLLIEKLRELNSLRDTDKDLIAGIEKELAEYSK